MKKYFDFSGTINGTNFLLRNILSTVFSCLSGYMIGYGLGSVDYILVVIGVLSVIPSLWFNLSTIYKRSNALFPKYSLWITLTMFLLPAFAGAVPVLNLIPMILGLILLFKNSNIDNHEG